MEHNGTRFTLGLIVLGAAARLLPHPPNVTPLAAMALLGGACLSRRQALALPLAAMVLSDLFLGFHATVPFVYASFLATVGLGMLLRENRAGGRIAAAALGASVLFFIVSNFGVWLTSAMYPRDLAGLQACYTAALPFFRNALLGDLFFAGLLFGLDRVTRGLAPQPAAA